MIELTSGASFAWLRDIRMIATDVDGTLTNERGCFSAELIGAFEECQRAGVSVVLVTGRPASWVQGMVEYLPVAGGIGENGGVYCPKRKEAPMGLLILDDEIHDVSIGTVQALRAKHSSVFEYIKREYPHLLPSSDCVTRLTDFAFQLNGLEPVALERIARMCEELGCDFTYSSIHGHIKSLGQNKASGVLKVSRLIPELSALPSEILTVGDSRNDQEMFDSKLFPYSVGVRNIESHLASMHIHPQYITTASGGAGFCEMVRCLVSARK